MAAKQEVFRVRRHYNQWVNNQTLEDYALRFTAKNSRRWSTMRVANTALGAISFLALEAIGAAITLHYGFANATLAITVVSILIFFAGLPICYYAAKYGVDIDLLTRGAGFGYIGSTATSLIYSSFTFIFFALEAAIMAKAMELLLGLPLALGYIVSSVVVIPLAFHGITFISRFQSWTQPAWFIMQLLPFIFILYHDSGLLADWQYYNGTQQDGKGINLLLFGAAASVMFSLMAQIGEQVDFLRFLPEKQEVNRKRWWFALIMGGPGWIIVGALKMLAGSFLAVVAINQGVSAGDASDPTRMYTVAFNYVTDNSHLALVLAGIFVVLSQLKINVTNAYAGSIAWSNFFSRLTHSHPGRVVWLVFNVAIALMLMELGIYQAFESTLSVYAIVAVSWVGALVADLTINKPLGLSPKHIEFKRAHLYDINPVGVGATIAASALGIASYLGVFGETAHALAHFIALAIAFLCVPMIAILTKSRYYIARTPYVFSDTIQQVECSICQNAYEIEDIAHCPAYDGFICSLCCSLDARCNDSCKNTHGLLHHVIQKSQRVLPRSISKYINIQFIQFCTVLSVVATVTGILLVLIYSNIQTDVTTTDALIKKTLWEVFFILMIIAGVISWLFVLTYESRLVAQEESQRQTKRLMEEINAHEKTDQKLQEARDNAEAANNAKSRYLTGISHELRTPLNSVLGYAQLLEMDKSVPEKTYEKITIIRRSSQHLADLIEGLLDISKIEAGRLDIQKNNIILPDLIHQIVDMFRLQAEKKGLSFIYKKHSHLPELVIGDEKRLRQILINLLSNAIKFTETGEVCLSIRYRNQVAEFKVSDTGTGIPEGELERIFKPFERVRRPETPSVSGTGLGLTITRLLTDIMGGDIHVKNNIHGGATFTVQLALSSANIHSVEKLKPRHIVGYEGEKKSIMVVDDEASHRGLISDFLTPLGFSVVEAPDAETCLNMLIDFKPDLFLLDRLMPGMSGPELALAIRQKNIHLPILIISANATEDGLEEEKEPAYDGYLIKPIKLQTLIKNIGQHLDIVWIEQDEDAINERIKSNSKNYHQLHISVYQELLNHAEIGHLNGLKKIISILKKDPDIDPKFIENIIKLANSMQFKKIIELIQAQIHD